MKDLILLQVVPHDLYFQWQIEVQIVNFREFGLSDKMQVLVWYPKNSNQLDAWKVIETKYPEVHFYYYEDAGVNLGLYIPQLRPHTLKKHFEIYKEELKDKVFFYHDSDIIFNYIPDFDMLSNDDICWESDTSGYLDYNYLRSKEKQGNLPEEEAISLLAEIGGITTDIIKSYTGKTGGAQTILKGIDSDFWKDVEEIAINIRKQFFWNQPDSVNKKYFKSEADGFQSWCADMWALNFALWKRGIKSDVTKDLDFSWATDSLETFLKKPIFHNAGVARSGELFYKGEWIAKSPLNQDIPLPAENTASRKYVEAIKKVK